MRRYDAILLAGGRALWLKEYCGTDARCLAPLGGRRIIDHILKALRASGRIRRIVIATTPEAAEALRTSLPNDIRLCMGEDSLPATALAAVQALGEDATPMLLGICDDIPLLNAAALNDFLEQCERFPDKEIFYPIIPKEACLSRFPEAQRTYGRLTDGVFTGGNMMLLSRDMILRKQELGKQIFALRKSPLRLANWLGWSFILQALFHRLSVAAAEERFSKIMRTPGKAIITSYAEIGMDIDKLSDLRLAEKYLSN